MSVTVRQRAVLIEHGTDRRQRVQPGDECYLTLPCQDADALVVVDPEGKRSRPQLRRRHFNGTGDTCAIVTAGKPGRYTYRWKVAGRQVRGSFQVGRREAAR
jgi:hypothetical protein